MTDLRVGQAPALALASVNPDIRVTQAPVLAMASVAPPLRVTQIPTLVLASVVAPLRLTQVPVLVLGAGTPCTTKWAQIWTITRTDGEVFRFTSKDTDLVWGGETYSSCDSLSPSASENVSEVDAAGNMDLSGAIGPDGITVAELYAGVFDGAVAEAWLVPWEGTTIPKRLLKGTFGPVEQTPTGFKVELLGDGAKFMQTPLIDLIQPGCRWMSGKYGGFGGPFCGVDLGPLTVTGTVEGGVGVRSFTDSGRSEPAGYFSRGRVTFTSGSNAGVGAEIKAHFTGGGFQLWPTLAFPIAAGDQYSMTPGCTGLHEASGGTNGCEAWNNKARYGGFLKVPGRDKRSAAAQTRQ